MPDVAMTVACIALAIAVAALVVALVTSAQMRQQERDWWSAQYHPSYAPTHLHPLDLHEPALDDDDRGA